MYTLRNICTHVCANVGEDIYKRISQYIHLRHSCFYDRLVIFHLFFFFVLRTWNAYLNMRSTGDSADAAKTFLRHTNEKRVSRRAPRLPFRGHGVIEGRDFSLKMSPCTSKVRRDRENSNRVTKPRVADNSRVIAHDGRRLTTILIVAHVVFSVVNNKMKDVYHNNSFCLSISNCECSTVSEKIHFRMPLADATRFLAVTMIRNDFIVFSKRWRTDEFGARDGRGRKKYNCSNSSFLDPPKPHDRRDIKSATLLGSIPPMCKPVFFTRARKGRGTHFGVIIRVEAELRAERGGGRRRGTACRRVVANK